MPWPTSAYDEYYSTEKDEEEKPGANFVTVLWPDVLVLQEPRTILVSVAIFFWRIEVLREGRNTISWRNGRQCVWVGFRRNSYVNFPLSVSAGFSMFPPLLGLVGR